MEKRQTLLLIATLIGILILLFLSQNLKPELKQISEIIDKDLNQIIRVSAHIENVREYNDNTFQVLTLKDSSGNITGIMSANYPVKINKSANYSISGKIQSYNNTLQISINHIELK